MERILEEKIKQQETQGLSDSQKYDALTKDERNQVFVAGVLYALLGQPRLDEMPRTVIAEQ